MKNYFMRSSVDKRDEEHNLKQQEYCLIIHKALFIAS
jgi:hypothetical protein